MRGRLALQLFILLGTGCLTIAFALQVMHSTMPYHAALFGAVLYCGVALYFAHLCGFPLPTHPPTHPPHPPTPPHPTPPLQTQMAESVVLMIFFSIFAEAGCGATFGITPAVDPKNTGAVYGAGTALHQKTDRLPSALLCTGTPYPSALFISLLHPHTPLTFFFRFVSLLPCCIVCSGRGRQHGRGAVGGAVPVAWGGTTARYEWAQSAVRLCVVIL
jgi:hypothetical protein